MHALLKLGGNITIPSSFSLAAIKLNLIRIK